MADFFETLQQRNVTLPPDAVEILRGCQSFTIFDTVDQLVTAAVGGEGNNQYEVKYTLPDGKEVSEVIVHRVTNGISANYTEAYMRRRDPDTMLIGDDLPTDKDKFEDVMGYPFEDLRKETLAWMKTQDLAAFFFFAGRDGIGSGGIAIAPANAGFFAMGLALLQQIQPHDALPEGFSIESAIYVAPTFRHTHFGGKQKVVHCRSAQVHQIYSYNLYPGPSAKKGLYGALLTKGEKEGWITAHCSTVQVASPYDNITTFMHEGASGGGKSEMLQTIVREKTGEILVGTNTIKGDKVVIHLPLFCNFFPVTDDMALCHPSLQQTPGKLTVQDAENAWFIRVDSITEYGSDPLLEKLTIKPTKPLLFINVQSNPDSTALIWDHTMDAPGKPCPNPRVIVPRSIVPNVTTSPVNIDVRSFGVRTPPCTRENPTYGIVGMFHVLPPALAWLWRLVAPRGHANPSIVDGGSMGSEGVGSYWPFATGKRITHANILLKQIIDNPRTRYTLVPNQHVGAWKVGFKPQLLMREYLTRRGNAKLRPEQYQVARCPLLGFEFNYLTIENERIPTRLLKVYKQAEVGMDGYDAGAAILFKFFETQLAQYITPDMDPLGLQIIDTCLRKGTVEEFAALIPMAY